MQTESPGPDPISPNAHVLERILAAQSEMTAALPNENAIMRLVTRHAMELSRATGANIGVREGDDIYMVVNEGFTRSWEGVRMPVGSMLTGQCLLTGEQISLPDLVANPVPGSEAALAAGIRSFLAVPLNHEGRVVAALGVASPQPHAFDEDDILVVKLLSRLAGSKLAHAQSFRELTVALADAKQARAESAEFAGMIAHELGSPIAAIQNANDVLGLMPLAPQQDRARELIAMEARALRMLVGDLRAAAALERESFDLHRRVISLDALLVEAGDFAQTVADSHPVHVQADSGLQIDVDPGRIAQVLRNLVTNAAKYTPSDTPIDIRSWREQDRAWIEVADTGPGIAPEDVDLILSKFGRARHRSDQKIPGLGLGLYLSKRIVEAHGGELIVTSRPGEGASFAFSVPITTSSGGPAGSAGA